MLHRFWLFFAQAVTVVLTAWSVIAILKPDWLQRGRVAMQSDLPIVALKEVAPTDHGGTSSNSYAGTAKVAMPTVVNIFSSKNVPKHGTDPQANADPWFCSFFGDHAPEQRQESTASLGSGVIVSSEGYILTNHRVVDGAGEVEVALTDGRKANVKVIGSDPETDLAVLKINLPNLPAITLDRLEDVRVGDVVSATGNPLGVGQMVTMGIVSALGRSHLGINAFENFIQTDAAINPGNSGGALADVDGNLLGIDTAIYSRSGGSLGIGFAIPVSLAKQAMEPIISADSVARGWIGVESQDVTPKIVESLGLSCKDGALTVAVVQGGSVDRAGPRPGDIFTSMNSQPILDTTALLNSTAQLKSGVEAKVTVLRKGKAIELITVIGKRPSPTRRNVPMSSQGDEEQQ